MQKKPEELELINVKDSNVKISLEPNWNTWEEVKTYINDGRVDSENALFIEVINNEDRAIIGLSLPQMKKMRKYLKDKIKYLEGEI